MNPETELAQLKEEVAVLRRQMAELRQFITVECDDTPERKPVCVNLRCGVITLYHPSAPDETQGILCASEDGPSLTLWTRGKQGSLTITTEQDVPAIQLWNKDDKAAVDIMVDKETGRGQVAVFDQGNPRALMKSTDVGGVLSVVHDDGRVRACLISEANGGEVNVLGAQGKVAVKLSDNPEQGGFVAVSNHAGRPKAAMCAMEDGGAMHILQDQQEIAIALIAKADNANICLGTGKEHENRISLFSHPAGASISVRNAQGTVVGQLVNEPAGCGLRLCDQTGQERIILRQTQDGPIHCLRSATGQNLASLSVLKDSGMADICSANGHKATLVGAANGPGLFFCTPEGTPSVVLTGGGGTLGLLLQPQAGPSPVGGLFVGEHGGVCVLSDREGIRRAGLSANQAGGQVSVFNDLGIERALLCCASDGGLLKLNWGGTIGVSALAMHEGGVLVVNDAHGKPAASLPPGKDEDDEDGK